LVFTTFVESVYSAVRTDSSYKADYVSSLKGYNGPASQSHLEVRNYAIWLKW